MQVIQVWIVTCQGVGSDIDDYQIHGVYATEAIAKAHAKGVYGCGKLNVEAWDVEES